MTAKLKRNKPNTLPSTPSSISSRLNTGTVESICLPDFFLSDPFLLDFELFFREPPQSEDSAPALLCLGLSGGSYPYNAVLLKTHPVPT